METALHQLLKQLPVAQAAYGATAAALQFGGGKLAALVVAAATRGAVQGHFCNAEVSTDPIIHLEEALHVVRQKAELEAKPSLSQAKM
eukprot:9304497-Prorocentrum_lima.AAC.1